MNPINTDFGLNNLGFDRIEGPVRPDAAVKNAAAESAEGGSFKDLLHGLVQQVDTLQKDADASIQGLVTGETTNIHDVTIKMEEAGTAFDLMMQVRNKLMEAYQELIKMQS